MDPGSTLREPCSVTGHILEDLEARGLVADRTDPEALRARLEPDHPAGPVTVYCGFDPTADSFHVGNLQQILALRRFQDAGHRPIALAGGATGMIGDPGGRSEERTLLDDETLDANLVAIKAQLGRFLDLDGPRAAVVVDNRDWTAPLGMLEFLREVGKHATVNQMIARDSVRARLESSQGISYTEFSYMLLQANDFWHLHRSHGCELEIGGSDQWGNIAAGVDLVRRRDQAVVHGLTMPLLTDAQGAKFGKSTGGGNTWLDPARTSPYRFSQFFIQAPDELVETLLLRLTLLDVAEVAEVMADHRVAPERRRAQHRLADELTTLVHGAAAARAAQEAAAVLFGGDPGEASPAALETVAREVGAAPVSQHRLEAGLEPVEVLVTAGLAASKGQARRTIDQGGGYINGRRLCPGDQVSTADLLAGRWVVVRSGKRRYALLDAAGSQLGSAASPAVGQGRS